MDMTALLVVIGSLLLIGGISLVGSTQHLYLSG